MILNPPPHPNPHPSLQHFTLILTPYIRRSNIIILFNDMPPRRGCVEIIRFAAPSRRNQQQNSNGKLTCPSSGRTAFHHLVMWGETSCRAMSVRDLENAPEIMVASTSALVACDKLRRCVRPTTSPKGTNLNT